MEKYYFRWRDGKKIECLPKECIREDQFPQDDVYRNSGTVLFLMPADLRDTLKHDGVLQREGCSIVWGEDDSACMASVQLMNGDRYANAGTDDFSYFLNYGRRLTAFGRVCTVPEFVVGFVEELGRYPHSDEFSDDIPEEVAQYLQRLRDPGVLKDRTACVRVTEGGYRLPEGFHTVGDGLFCGWEDLHVLYVPDGYDTIGVAAFERCDSLSTVRFPSSLREIRERAFARTSLSLMISWGGVESIGSGAFCGAKLSHVLLPSSVRRIDSQAFLGNRLRSIQFSEGLEFLASDAISQETCIYAPMFSATMRIVLDAGYAVRKGE